MKRVRQGIIFIIMMGLVASCNPCRNGKTCHRAGDRVKKRQERTSQRQHQSGGGGFSF